MVMGGGDKSSTSSSYWSSFLPSSPTSMSSWSWQGSSSGDSSSSSDPSSSSSKRWSFSKLWIDDRNSNHDGENSSNEGGRSWIPSPPSYMSSVLSSMSTSSFNPFSSTESHPDDNNKRQLALVPTVTPTSTLHKFASRFGWATTTTKTSQNNTKSTRKRSESNASYYRSTVAAAVVGLGRWDDRFATYDNNYYSYLPLYNPAASNWGIRVQGGDEKTATFSTTSGEEEEEQRQVLYESKKSMFIMEWWRKSRRKRPSESSVQAVRSMVSLVQQQLLLSSNAIMMEEQADDVNIDREEKEQVGDEEDEHQQLRQSSSLDSVDPSVGTRSSPVRGNTDVTAAIIGSVEYDAAVASAGRQTTALSKSSRRIHRQSVIFGRSSTLTTEGDANCYTLPQNAEVAARLAVGVLKAYRDIALDEAAELHDALHHWTVRWLHPLLAFLEAGPYSWWIGDDSCGAAGKRVSQIQAVLARRCAVIGELQQHLWRASWQKGVAAWGMLGGGVGGEWTSVVGEFGNVDNNTSFTRGSNPSPSMKILNHSDMIGTNVSNSPGGSIVVDEDAMVRWSVDAMQVIRDQLYRACQDVEELPYVDNWPRERRHFKRDEGRVDCNVEVSSINDLPVWATMCDAGGQLSEASSMVADVVCDNQSSIMISDLGKMADEVSALLQSIEVRLEQQRDRRLERLRPPSRIRRNWYLYAIGAPVGAFAVYKLTREYGGRTLVKLCTEKIAEIYQDHVSEPLNSIYQELFTQAGQRNVTDRKARVDTIESLKRMIRSWLEETFPDMPLKEMKMRAENMDISLLEERKEASMKNFYELNSVIRMSLIEMQFIKKELLSALVAMDELMGSNEINMRIAAMTPALILLYSVRRGFRLLLYGFFRIGKTKEQIYSSFRQTILDIERLLLMRESPPSPPDPLEWGSTRTTMKSSSAVESRDSRPQTLSAEDLGMLILHIHECRNILWESRRRFQPDEIRNVAEDLAELAGERGPVSVSQQLAIITRMSRTYPFMKVVSSGILFGSDRA